MSDEDLLPPDPFLKAPPAVEKVIDLNEVHTFKCGSTVAYIEDDTTDQPFSTHAEVIFTNPVPVMGDDSKIIGYATVRLDGVEALGRRLEGQFFLSRECSERLDIEAGTLMYPHPLYEIQEGERLEDDRLLVKKARLLQIELSQRKNDDPAISPLAPVL